MFTPFLELEGAGLYGEADDLDDGLQDAPVVAHPRHLHRVHNQRHHGADVGDLGGLVLVLNLVLGATLLIDSVN